MDRTNIRMGLRLMGDEYDVQEVTRKLNISPTKIWYKGEHIRKTEKEYLYTAWIYQMETKETLDIGTYLKEFEAIFSSKVEEIAFLKEKYNLDISIDFAVVIEKKEVPAMYFEPEFIQLVDKMGAVIDIDMYIN